MSCGVSVLFVYRQQQQELINAIINVFVVVAVVCLRDNGTGLVTNVVYAVVVIVVDAAVAPFSCEIAKLAPFDCPFVCLKFNFRCCCCCSVRLYLLFVCPKEDAKLIFTYC